MTAKISIGAGRQALDHCVAHSEKHGMEAEIVANAKAGCKHLSWFEARVDLIREWIRLEKENPEIAEVLRGFPGAYISAMKLRCPTCNSQMEPDDHYEISRDA